MKDFESSRSLNHKPLILLYGPPGSGKSVVGFQLASDLGLSFLDLDLEIEKRYGMSVPEIFASEEESGFREKERIAFEESLATFASGVISLGGGTLLDPSSQSLAERSGRIVCLIAKEWVLLERLLSSPSERPLLSEAPQEKLGRIFSMRRDNYD
jgi:shikimate kinase